MADAIAYYRFEGNLNDSAGSANGSVVNGSPVFTASVPATPIPQNGLTNAQSISFNASSVNDTSATAIDFNYPFPFNTPGDATLEFWVNPSRTIHDQGIFWGRTEGGDFNRFNIFLGDNGGCTLDVDYREPGGTLHPLLNSQNGGVRIPAIPLNDWTFVALVRTGNTYSVYLNNSLTPAATAVDVNPNLPTSTTWTLNGWCTKGLNAYGLVGKIDEIRLSNTALSPSQFLVNFGPGPPVWNGGGTDDNWTTAANWSGRAPVSNDELVFGPATHVSNYNNLPADTQFNGITFRNDAATYTLTGNRVKLAGPVVNNSSVTQTIALNLVLESGGGVVEAAAGNIVLSGTVGGSVNLIKRGAVTLTLTNTVSPSVTVEQGQVVAAPGSLVNGNLTIAAAARFENTGGTVSLQNLTNNGTLAGNTQVGGTLANQSAGSVRIGTGQKVLVLGTTAHDNAGLIEALGNPYVLGGQAEFECIGPLTSAAGTGMITGRSAVLRFTGGLANQGALALSYGLNDVFGDVNNTGNISVAGGAGVTFYDDVIQNGSLVVSAVGATRSTAVFFGGFTGSGGFSGGGDVFLMGDLRPGNSPVEVHFGGNVFLAGTTHTLMELGGTLPGSQYDKMDVTGTLAVGGLLEVALYNGFAPKAGDSFDLFDGTIEGTFDAVTLPALDSGLSWNQSQLYSTGVISVVPEPSTVALLGIVGLGLAGWAWRKARRGSC